jgi:hypothetical protein
MLADLWQELGDEIAPSRDRLGGSVKRYELFIHQVVGVPGSNVKRSKAQAQAFPRRNLPVGQPAVYGIRSEEIVGRDLEGLSNLADGLTPGFGLTPEPFVDRGLLEA